jgi:hypothetical protein
MALTTPGEVLAGLPGHAPPPPRTLPAPWYAVSLKDGSLVLTAVQATRKPDWREIFESTGTPAAGDTPEQPRPQHALALPDSALIGFQLSDTEYGSPLPVPVGSYPSALPLPVVLRDRWAAIVKLDGKAWHLSTAVMRRKDGGPLAGSLSLVAALDSGEKRVLLPPTTGAAFEREELLWLGTVHSDHGDPEIDILVKRTLLTGKVEYVLKLGNAMGSVMFDPDHPYAVFSSGIEAYVDTEVHVRQHRPLPPAKFGTAAFSIAEEAWNPAVDAAEKEGLPKLLFDRQLQLDGENLRFTIEYLPRVDAGGSPLSVEDAWAGPVIVKAHFRGNAQVLLETARLDDGPFTLQVGKLGGKTAIQVANQPHYNNSFLYYWAWDGQQQRFIRLYKRQEQGC